MAVELRQLGPRGGHKPARCGLGGGGASRACDSLMALLAFFQTFGGLFWSQKNHRESFIPFGLRLKKGQKTRKKQKLALGTELIG